MKWLFMAVCLIVACGARADIAAEIGATSVDSKLGAQFRIGSTRQPVYLWGSWNNQDLKMLGQSLAEADVYGVGIGVEKKWDDVSGFIEVGYGMVEEEVNEGIRQEIVYTQLLLNHNVANRPIPVTVDRPYGTDTYETSYEIDDGYMARVGVGYQINKYVKVTAAYRMFYAEESYDLYDAERRAAGKGYWTERDDRNLDAFEIGLYVTY
jgi:hypothetical protein